jgi:hypothetical protein
MRTIASWARRALSGGCDLGLLPQVTAGYEQDAVRSIHRLEGRTLFREFALIQKAGKQGGEALLFPGQLPGSQRFPILSSAEAGIAPN